MKVEIQELDPCKRQLVVEAPEEEVRAAWTAACGRVQRDARLPGFRRGKVPLTLVRSRFGDEVRQAVAEALIPAVYRRAVDEAHLRPVEDPEFRELQLEEGQPLRFTAVVEIKPAIALGEYRGVTARHSPRPVTDADVEGTLTALAEQRATLVTVTRPARVGDFVVIDYELRPEAGEPRRRAGLRLRGRRRPGASRDGRGRDRSRGRRGAAGPGAVPRGASARGAPGAHGRAHAASGRGEGEGSAAGRRRARPGLGDARYARRAPGRGPGAPRGRPGAPGSPGARGGGRGRRARAPRLRGAREPGRPRGLAPDRARPREPAPAGRRPGRRPLGLSEARGRAPAGRRAVGAPDAPPRGHRRAGGADRRRGGRGRGGGATGPGLRARPPGHPELARAGQRAGWAAADAPRGQDPGAPRRAREDRAGRRSPARQSAQGH